VIAVRPATPIDLPRLADIHAQAFTRPWSPADLEALLTGQGRLALLAEVGAGAAGFILVQTVIDEGEILTLAVLPEHWRSGVGRALVLAAVKACHAAGAASLWLEVADDNAAALGLYAQVGFVDAGRRRGYYRREDGATADAVVLRRNLNSLPPSAYAAAP
jgi:[ribosomal protein S18]-alanine N-acetyltransferase